jgi:hypothetical protein
MTVGLGRTGRTGPRQSAQQTGAIYRTKSLGVTADICLGPTAITLDVGNLVTATRYEFTESHPFGDWMKQGNAGIVYTFIIHVYVYIYILYAHHPITIWDSKLMLDIYRPFIDSRALHWS